jgi:hypothetical protein
MCKENKPETFVGRLEARYSNYLTVGQNSVEFILEFGQMYSDDESARMHTRIVSAPMYAKAFLETLDGAIRRYEEINGPIPAWLSGKTTESGPIPQ